MVMAELRCVFVIALGLVCRGSLKTGGEFSQIVQRLKHTNRINTELSKAVVDRKEEPSPVDTEI